MDITGQLALWLRVYLLYPAVGALATWVSTFAGGLMTFDPQTGQLVIDLTWASVAIAGAVVASGSGIVFGASRWMKAKGWAT
jgi:hypothetical protein